MIRKTLRKIIPDYAIFPLALTGIMNLFAYQGGKLLRLLFCGDRLTDMTTAFDRMLPFSPPWVLVYVGTFVFWFCMYTAIARESREAAYRLAAADAFAKLICLVFFVAIPTTNVRPPAEGDGFFLFAMRVVYVLDSPYNLFPSIHCFVAWLGARYMFECKHLRHRRLTACLCVVGALLVFASTLFTKQHVIYDVIGGVVVAEIGWLVARYTKLPRLIAIINERFMKAKFFRFL